MSEKQAMLLDVPKMAPSRFELAQREIDAAKVIHGIWTNKCEFIRREDEPWTALLLPTGPCGADIPYGEFMREMESPEEMIAGYCRILEECGCLRNGKTEREAMDRIMERLKLTWPADRRAARMRVAKSFLSKEIPIRQFPNPKE